ncbi:NAV2 protein, putative [Ixodes scapularis]|uniref:NAV2 protein, putative n=1 Tax=Ixodes scapularis TaxID=6945 RepID=B7QF22_IXOSC|nr:NAV2 protein, putative [Ixodes scapularis]|eukprot:XP_002414136.1 NAV2 protein, putative [Ixodes scapularis]
MVAAFEQSLSNMTSRLQHLTATAEQKVSSILVPLSELMIINIFCESANFLEVTRVVCTTSIKPKISESLQDHRMSRQLSTDSMSSVNSASSACSNASTKNEENGKKHKKKKGWLRSSFSKAFSRSKKNRHGSVSDVEDIRAFQSDSSAPNSPLLSLNPAHTNGLHSNLGDHNMLKLSHSSFALHEREEEGGPEVVQELRKQLREKDLVLTDIRLEALSSAHQLDNLKETLARMRNEMLNLKQDNDRLQRLVSSKSLNSSQTSLPHRNSMDTLENRLSAAELSPTFDVPDVTAAEIPEGKRVTIAIQLGCHGDLEKFLSKSETPSEVLIGSIYVSGKTKWDHLDSAVRRAFKDHVLKVDPLSNLGLNSESILCYHIDDVVRSKEAELPELLPCGYLVGETLKIQIVLRGTAQNAVDALALQTLIPKSIVQRYVSLLSEHRRIILCGPSGTGKTFLAQKLAEYLVLRSGRDLAAGSIATFSVDHKSAKELRQYLSNVAEQCESSNVSDLPAVIILDNLHHVGSLGEVFNGFLSAKYQKCPFIIGTMNQATCSTTNLQLHHNFRSVLSPAIPGLPDGCGQLPSMVHRPLELQHCAVSSRSRSGGTTAVRQEGPLGGPGGVGAPDVPLARPGLRRPTVAQATARRPGLRPQRGAQGCQRPTRRRRRPAAQHADASSRGCELLQPPRERFGVGGFGSQQRIRQSDATKRRI